MSTRVEVSVIPMCDIHSFVKGDSNVPAKYDGATTSGRWANMCQECFTEHGVGLGTGRGQELVLRKQG